MNTLRKILLFLVILIAGFLIGSRTVISLYKKHHPEFVTYRSGYGSAKMDALMNAINRKYVDIVDMDSIVDRVLPTILEESAMMSFTAVFQE